MQDGFQYGDIVFLALLAGFIFWRLRSVLGKRMGSERPSVPMRTTPTEEGTVITLPPQSVTTIEPEEDLALATGNNHSVIEGLEAIRARDPAFNRKRFLQGAKGAFEVVVEAYSKGDMRTLERLVSPQVRDKFEAEIARRQKLLETHEITLVSVEPTEINAAEMNGDMARVTVVFHSEQIALTRNAEGTIVHGSASQIDKVEDIWTFERDVRSPNPNWTVMDT